ncbi:MAG: putative Ig domain-containing protein, partial [Candidatus Acidiferrales bacterium]
MTTAANSNKTTVDNVSSLTITTSTLSAAHVQSSYQASITASGGKQPYVWSIASGSLPPGLFLTSSTGTISGKPSQSGTFNFSAQVQDSSSPLATVTRSLAVTVSTTTPQLQITTGSLPAGQVGTAYQATFAATGGTQPYTWSATSGSLPSGLTLNSSTGVLSGSPTQQGTFGFTIRAADSTGQSATAPMSVAITSSTPPPPSALAITTSFLPSGQVSQPYSTTLSAAGGKTPYTWGMTSTSGPLPAGLTLSATTGTISGTPTTSSSYSFTIQVSDNSSTQQVATRTYTLSTAGVTLDQYGGRQDIKCATVTPYFHLEKINNQWFFCDALGNALVSMSVGAVLTNGNPTNDCNGINTYPIYIAKYGDTNVNWGWQTLKRMISWGFNSVGQDSGGNTLPWQTSNKGVWPGGKQPIPIPYITEIRPGSEAAINTFGFLTEPIKDEISGSNNNWTGWRGGALFDVFDPKLSTEFQNDLLRADPSITQVTSNSPYLLGVFTDDSDWFTGAGAGPDFAGGKTTNNPAFTTLLTSPVRTFAESPSYSASKSFLYQDTKVYSKALATNPTTPCSISSPCSLRDYLWQKYNGNIGNLNAAWGSNYTTFDSAGTQVTGEAIGTGNGSTTTFTHTLAHTAVSPFSVLISVGGKAQIGDCPWFHKGCIATTANTGSLGSPTANFVAQSTSSINYSTGSVT